IDEIPADRLGTASEVADLVYMVSEMSTYMTGQIITIDGGWTL
ncbi:MAG: SDR family oxidoreductase, partial [Lachnospiraceae bacterium]|nr:SDR family oxidoreductase [Lachnospiraceae bacterium]